jgi:hypothetical protein
MNTPFRHKDLKEIRKYKQYTRYLGHYKRIKHINHGYSRRTGTIKGIGNILNKIVARNFLHLGN